MGEADRNEQQSGTENQRNKIRLRIFISVCAVFVAIVVGADLIEALKTDTKRVVSQVSEELSSQLPSQEQIDKAIDDVAKQLPKEIETDNYGYPELQEDESGASLPSIEGSGEGKEEAFEPASPSFSEGKEAPAADKGTVREIVEADTFLLDISGKEYRARLADIDVDENLKNENGLMAIDAVREIIKQDDEVSLSYPEPAYDKFSRLLVNVTLSDGTDLKEWLKEQGFEKQKEEQ